MTATRVCGSVRCAKRGCPSSRRTCSPRGNMPSSSSISIALCVPREQAFAFDSTARTICRLSPSFSSLTEVWQYAIHPGPLPPAPLLPQVPQGQVRRCRPGFLPYPPGQPITRPVAALPMQSRAPRPPQEGLLGPAPDDEALYHRQLLCAAFSSRILSVTLRPRATNTDDSL